LISGYAISRAAPRNWVDRKEEIDRIVLEKTGHVEQLGATRKRAMAG